MMPFFNVISVLLGTLGCLLDLCGLWHVKLGVNHMLSILCLKVVVIIVYMQYLFRIGHIAGLCDCGGNWGDIGAYCAGYYPLLGNSGEWGREVVKGLRYMRSGAGYTLLRG